jgi:hypothetical protein
MRITTGMLISMLLLPACGQDTRRIKVLTPFSVRELEQRANLLWVGAGAESTSLSEITPVNLPIGVGTEYCFQDDLRMSYTDARQGYPSFSGRINLITKRSATFWAPYEGPVGLTGAINLLKDSSQSFLPAPITLDLPVNARGTIRIEGVLVKPEGNTQVLCPKISGLVPYPSFAIWGETKLEPGGPSSLTVPVNVISTTPLDNSYSATPYSTPALVGNGTVATPTPPSDLLIRCRNYSNPLSCMNRGLLELSIMPVVGNQFTINAFGSQTWDTFESKLKGPASASNTYYFYLPKKNVFTIEYTINNGSGGNSNILIELDLVRKRYVYTTDSSNPTRRDMASCTVGGQVGIKGPTSLIPLPLQPDNCDTGDPAGANILIKDLGFGF